MTVLTVKKGLLRLVMNLSLKIHGRFLHKSDVEKMRKLFWACIFIGTGEVPKVRVTIWPAVSSLESLIKAACLRYRPNNAVDRNEHR